MLPPPPLRAQRAPYLCGLAAIATLLLAAVLQPHAALAQPWNLKSYELCRHVRLNGVPAEASGITYSPVTNSLYVITRNPRAIVEYNLEGRRLRSFPYDNLSDPEGITWMYDYTFAVAQEGRATAAITVMDLVPWRESAVIRRRLVLGGVRCQTNFCFEGVTYDHKRNVFYALQEMKPMTVWKVSPGSGTAVAVMDGELGRWPGMRDLAGAYFRANSTSGLYLLSQATQNVARVEFNSTVVDIVHVDDNMVEGLTFTPDGHLMITVGEPNDLWVYSSTGECEWKPGSGYRIPRPPTQVQQERMANLRAPIDVDPDGGYCNWNGCDGTIQGNQWCNRDVDHCVGDCKGTWCWWDGIGQTISPDNYEPPPEVTQEPERTGFCSYDASCDVGREGPEICHSAANLCVLGSGCGGSLWCWDDGLSNPLTRADFPENATAVAMPAPTLNPGSIPDNVNAVKVEDESFRMMGYEAKVTLVLENITTTQFTPLQQLYFRQAVAHVAYGTPNGFLQVVFNTTSREARSEWGFFKEILLPATLERLAATESQGLEDDVLVISVFLLGETRAHAQLLGNRTVDGVESGRFKQSLDLLRFKTDINASVSRAAVTVADVPPQYFPSAVIEDVVYRDSYEVVQVTINGTQPTPGPTATPAPEPQDPPSDSGANTGLIIGVAIAAAAVLVAVVAAAIIIIMHKRRRAAEGDKSAGAANETQPVKGETTAV
eukprot:jgi/Tetstr1/447407/TSEL_034842.t1